jgi:hypothetical protein
MSTNPFFVGGAGILVLVVYIFFCVVIFVVILRILYSVIWRGVRRGLVEFHKNDPIPPGA